MILRSPIHPGRLAAAPLRWLWWLGYVLFSCSRVGVDQTPGPALPVPNFVLRTDSTGAATLNLDSLAGGRPFTITFGTFRHGRVELAPGTSRLRYIATDTSRRWAADSGQYTFCQANECRQGQIKVRNARYRKDTVIVPPQPDTCTRLPLRRFRIDEAATRRISLGFAPTDTGTLVVSNIAYTLWRVGAAGSTLFDYIASGGPQNFYSGFDEITYSGTVQGRRVCGTIEVIIGDSCEPRAQPDRITPTPGGPTTILPATLLANDRGCGGQQGGFRLRLRPTAYMGSLRVPTRLGSITDTTIGGSQTLLYRRNPGAAGTDSFFYFTQNTATDLVTRAAVSLP